MRLGEKIDIDDGVVVTLGLIFIVAVAAPVCMHVHNQGAESAAKSKNERELGFAKAGLSKIGEDIWVKTSVPEMKVEQPLK